MALSTNKLFFISGNPNYEERKGVIEFYEDVILDWTISSHNNSNNNENNNNNESNESNQNNNNNDNNNNIERSNIKCIIAVPSFMIHQEILNYLSSFIHLVKSIYILRHYSDPDQYFVILLMNSEESSHLLVNDFSGRVLSTLQPTTCMIYSVKSINLIQDDSTLLPFYIRGVNPKYFQEINKLQLKSNENNNEKDIDENIEKNIDEEEVVCAVCLESISIENPNCFTTCCNHTFHISCLIPLESTQCPVCRFEHDSTTTLSMCSTCLLQPNNPSLNHLISDPSDTWVCLVCGYIGCGARSMNHSQLHYEEHLHAYAMNTETKRVWDYAGEGYVHRLILSRPDNVDTSLQSSYLNISNTGESKEALNLISNSSSNLIPRIKIVEVSDPRRTNDGFRSQHPPLTQQQEDYIVNRKLESVAEHYSGMLAWQLEQQREQYEIQLQKLRSFKNNESMSSESNHDVYQNSRWLNKIEQTLYHERIKLIKQKETALTRLQKVEREISILEEFNRNLEMNSESWMQQAEEATKNLNDIETSYRNSVAKLERKVRVLMKKIDNEHNNSNDEDEIDNEVNNNKIGEEGKK